jgi:hypothetical protein
MPFFYVQIFDFLVDKLAATLWASVLPKLALLQADALADSRKVDELGEGRAAD